MGGSLLGLAALLTNAVALPISDTSDQNALSPRESHEVTSLTLLHKGDRCWSSCGKSGSCDFCGSAGACCRKGQPAEGCGKYAGCKGKHCCVANSGFVDNSEVRECKATGMASFSVSGDPIEVSPGVCIIDPTTPVVVPIIYRDFDYGAVMRDSEMIAVIVCLWLTCPLLTWPLLTSHSYPTHTGHPDFQRYPRKPSRGQQPVFADLPVRGIVADTLVKGKPKCTYDETIAKEKTPLKARHLDNCDHFDDWYNDVPLQRVHCISPKAKYDNGTTIECHMGNVRVDDAITLT